MRDLAVFLLAVALLACGPPQAASDGGEASSSSTGDASSGETNPADGPEDEGPADTTSDDDGDGDFVPPHDQPHLEDCSIFDQDCDEGQKCVPTTSPNHDVSRCVPILGDGLIGETCIFDGHETGTDDCDANNHCWQYELNEEGDYVGTCTPLCQGEPYDNVWCSGGDEGCVGYQCRFLGQVGIPICILSCDPLAQECGEGKSCYYYGGYIDYSCSVSDGVQQVGEPCQSYDDCAPGRHCVNAENVPSCSDDACCTTYCELGDDALCESMWPETVCSEMLAEPFADGCPVYGLCLIP